MARQEEAKLALWRNIKDVLQRPDGLEYFETNMEQLNRLAKWNNCSSELIFHTLQMCVLL